MTYRQVQFTGVSADMTDMLIAQLSELQYEGFEEADHQLNAFIPDNLFDEPALKELAQPLTLSYTITTLPDINWNSIWESNFQPVIVDDFCVVRAEFHKPAEATQHEIIITPKMSFGTGHHATTYMMMQQMKIIDFTGKTVMDFGAGTGVLAILAEKLGAETVLAIDNDDWCITNAEENLQKNNTTKTQVKKADTAASDTSFDIILANITLNIILDNFPLFVAHLSEKGTLLLSGLLAEDEAIILNVVAANDFTLKNKLQRNSWICLLLERT